MGKLAPPDPVTAHVSLQSFTLVWVLSVKTPPRNSLHVINGGHPRPRLLLTLVCLSSNPWYIAFVMDDIFDSTFPQGNAAAAPTHEHHTAAGDEHAIINEGSNLPDAAAHEQPLRGKAATQGLTVEEKKERQKLQNRRAAERSRNKKREEL